MKAILETLRLPVPAILVVSIAMIPLLSGFVVHLAVSNLPKNFGQRPELAGYNESLLGSDEEAFETSLSTLPSSGPGTDESDVASFATPAAR